MAIGYARLRSVTARELIAALERDGFKLDRQVARIVTTFIRTGGA